MEDIDRIAKYEIAVERRMEKACERDGLLEYAVAHNETAEAGRIRAE